MPNALDGNYFSRWKCGIVAANRHLVSDVPDLVLVIYGESYTIENGSDDSIWLLFEEINFSNKSALQGVLT